MHILQYMQKSKEYQGKCKDFNDFPWIPMIFIGFPCFSMLFPRAANTAIYEDIGLAEPRRLGKCKNL